MFAALIGLAVAVVGFGVSQLLPVPQNLRTNFEDGQSLYALGEYKGAIQEYEKVVRFKSKAVAEEQVTVTFGDTLKLPVRDAAWYQIGNSRKKSGDEEGAIAAFRQVIDSPDVSEDFKSTVQFQLADSRFNQKKYKEAAEEYDTFIEKFPTSRDVGKAYFYSGWSRFELADYDGAIAKLNEMLGKMPHDSYAPDSQFRIASSYYEKKDYPKAVGEAQKVLTNYPRSPAIAEAQYLIANAYDEMKQNDQAIAAYDSVIALYDKMYELLRGSFREGRNVDFENYQRLFETSFLRIAEIYRERGDYQKSYETCVRAQEAVKEVNYKAKVQLLIGDNYVAWKNFDDGARAYALVITNYPTSFYPPQAQYKVGEAYYYKGDYEKAAEEYAALLQKFPDTDTELKAQALYSAGWSLEQGGKPDEAVKLYQQAVNDYPRSRMAPLCESRIGRIYYEQKRLDEAAAEYQKITGRAQEIVTAYQDDPAQAKKIVADANYSLGLVSLDQKRYGDAVAALTQVTEDVGLTYVGAQMALAQAFIAQGGKAEEAERSLLALLEKVKGNRELEPLTHFQMGQFYLNEKNYDKAVEHYSAVIQGFPESEYVSNSFYGRGSAYHSLGKFKDAAADYQRLLESKAPEDMKLRTKLALALAYSAMGRDRDATGILGEVASAGDPELARNAKIQQVALAEKESPQRAIESYNQTLAQAGEDREIRELILPRLANAYFRQERYQETIKTAQQLVGWGGDINPESIASARYLMGNSFMKLEQYDQAIEQYKQITTHHPKSLVASEALFQIGTAHSKMGLGGIEPSIEAFKQYVRDYPDHDNVVFALYLTAWGYYRLGDWQQAANAFQNLVNKFPQSQLTPEALYRAGEGLFNMKRFEDAMKVFQTLADRYPKSAYADDGLYSWAWCLISLKREAEAVPIFQRIVAEFPKERYAAQSQFTLGDYYYNLQQYDKATEEYKRFVQLFPNERVMASRANVLLANLAEIDAYSVYEKGAQLFDQEQYKEAIEIFNDVIQRYPNSDTAVSARVNIAAAYQAMEDYIRARDVYQQFVDQYEKMDKYSTQVSFVKSQLEELKKVL